MFSSRLRWDLRPNRLSQALQEKRRRRIAVLDLTESNPTHADLLYPDGEILHAIADPRSLRYDPAPAGLAEARIAVAGWYGGRGGDVAPERILLTASTSEAYAWLFKLLADPGDEVLVPRPSYPLFDYLAALESVTVVQYPLVYDHGWSIDLAALKHALTPRTRAVIVVNPNNPTGSFLKATEYIALRAICAASGAAIIADEVFGGFAFAADGHRVGSLIGEDQVLTFSLSGLSKIAALPQMKLAWIVVSGPAGIRAAALEGLELIADTFLSVATPVQYAAPGLLAVSANLEQQIRGRTAANLAKLRESVAGSPCAVLEVEGGWYATLRVPRTRTEEEWCLDLLLHEDVLVQPGFFYDFESEAYLIVSLLTEPEKFRAGLARILGRISAGTS
jgi:aspartate/methionine/tyrosine aminotransferase